MNSSSRYIHCFVKDFHNDHEQFITFVYAFPQKHLHVAFWEDILKLNPTNKPCAGCQNTKTFMNNFISFLNKGNLISLNAMRVPYTWCNGHDHNVRIYERHDRGIANNDWLNDFSDYNLHNYPIFCSNHSPILLSNNVVGEFKNNYSF